MIAETVYNVAQALPEAEKQRLLSMLQKDLQPIKIETKKKESDVWTHEECYNIIYPMLMARKRKNSYGHKLKVVK